MPAMSSVGGTRGRKIAAVHLFGIIYTPELEGMDLQAIAARAGCRSSLRGEIRKGVVLAEYVEPISYFSTDRLQSYGEKKTT